MTYDIGTIFVVLMENRSFDHMLGHLHADNPAVDGIRRDDEAWLDKTACPYLGQRYRPFRASNPAANIPVDPPHETDKIKIQMGLDGPGGFAMDGFVTTYGPKAPTVSSAVPPAVMGWFDGPDVPVLDFLARNFAVCNRWFAALPASTQPNRMMAMGGSTKHDDNVAPVPNQRLVYDWLNERPIRWRVYHHGVPFFMLMEKWATKIPFDDHFRRFDQLILDVEEEDAATFPQVVFIEPTYSDASFGKPANDDHAPAGVARGQAFLHDIYCAITKSKAIFDRSVTIITYDEHGGFFDHVSPPKVHTRAPAGSNYSAFETLGVRVPAVIISPFVKPGTVHDGVHDHTSILKFIGEIFGAGYGYDQPVRSRPVGNVLEILNNPAGRPAPTIADIPPGYLRNDALKAASLDAGVAPGATAPSQTQRGFMRALDKIRNRPGSENGKFADLL
jgi:phospholipase C